MKAHRIELQAPGAVLRAPEARFELASRPITYAGNRVRLLVNGEEYFPQLLAAIDAARRSIMLETYIFADDNIGARVAAALATAAGRGVAVKVLIDGYGGGDYARRLVRELGVQGVDACIYRPERWWRLERKLLRRLHRKIAVFDDALAFVGGINIIDDHNLPEGERGRLGPRFDFAVMCEGPIVAAVALACKRLWWTLSFVDPRRASGRLPMMSMQPVLSAFPDGVAASLLLRDNLRHRRAIERAYMLAIERASEDIVIASAYFLPGRRFRTALREAAGRGVRVRLLLQGRVEYALQHFAQRALYGQLLEAGIEIYEYEPSYLHAKVAVVDDRWATVGSSNIDPYSLLLAREANVVVYDTSFGRQLRSVLERAIAAGTVQVKVQDFEQRSWLAKVRDWVAFGAVRLATVLIARGRLY
ncbi:MAG TPA: cardiolipin synthase ClsB [Burkholderiaceae bacterium]|nr:cardiolipin synthase ClsB [Burkholderiaceae bacterium]